MSANILSHKPETQEERDSRLRSVDYPRFFNYAYSDKVLDHYENPRNVGSFDKNDKHVGTGMVSPCSMW